ncbi:MAG: hypothetical protein HC822_02735 [Oscillochloris sp.]|nr:hypothetical protein [Oscillochloris sp.]
MLLGTIERTGLNIAYTQELLDTHALGRSLSITCLPDGVEDDQGPEEPALRAVIGFRWSPEFTVFSLRGADSLDNIERLVDERLYAHQAHNGPSLDIEVTYHLPVSPEQQRDVGSLPLIARAIQDLYNTFVENDEQMRIDSQISFPTGRGPRVVHVGAVRTWSIDEALYDAELLADTFEELCGELHTMLELLAVHYVIVREEPNDGDDPADRRYLKPPTA